MEKKKYIDVVLAQKTMIRTYNKIPAGWNIEKEIITSRGTLNFPLAYMEREIFYCKKCYTVKRIIK